MPDQLNPERLYREIVDHTPLAIVFGDREGIIRLWNSGAEAMFGYSAAEAIGKSLDLIVPEKHRPKHWEGYDRVMQTGVTKYGRELLAVPALTKDGRRISIEFNVALLRDDSGQITGVAATISDVTARWEKEKALRARLAELEAKVKSLSGAAEAKSTVH
jgi:PAS domain S-box-containing protein